MLLTRSPLSPDPKVWFSLDLHVLSAPPAFVLSQDQTLREELFVPKDNLSLELVLKVPASEEARQVFALGLNRSPKRVDPVLDVNARC